jgi:hypothetical protein
MTQISDELDATLMLVRTADPLPRGDTSRLDTEAELRVLLANLPPAEPARSPRTRRRLLLGAVGLTAAAATVAAINLVPSGQRLPGSLTPSSGFVSQAQAAQIITNVKRAFAHYPAGEILITRQSGVTTQGGRTIGSWSISQWLSTSAPYRDRVAFAYRPGRSYEIGTTQQNLWQVYDPSRNVIYQRTPNPGYTLTRGPRSRWWTVTLPKASVLTPETPVPASDRGDTTITISDKTERALRSGVKQISYTVDATGTRARSYWLDPKVRPGMDATGGTRPPLPAADWVKGLTTRGTRVTLDGGNAIKISRGKNDTMWFAAKTLKPLKEVMRDRVYTKHGRPTNRWQSTTIRYGEYRVLKGAAASTGLLSVQRAHPTATLVIGVTPLYDAARRLGA